MIELTTLDPTIKLDIRYARSDNFVGCPVYDKPRAFLQADAAHALLCAHKSLSLEGFGLMIFDGYRPWSVTKLFWEVVTESEKQFVADPAIGSRHNRGCAVDLSMYDLSTGKPAEMPSDFDEFNEKASPDYAGGSATATVNRDLLRANMESAGFYVNPKEWWHFDYKTWQDYEILDIDFAEINT